MTNLGGPAVTPPPGRMMMDGPPTPTRKTRLCNKYNTAEGCKWGDKCHFAHGERELGKPMLMDSSMHSPMGPRPTGHFAPPPMANPGMATPPSFGASATAKISVDASLAGGIIGRSGVNTKHISRVTGAKLAIRDHESDTSLKNIELEGTFDQIKNASAMVRELIVNISGRPLHWQRIQLEDLTVVEAQELTSRPRCVRTSQKGHALSGTDATLPMVKMSCANLLLLEIYAFACTS